MKVAVLIDNNPHPSDSFATEHGLSIYFEQDGYKWLFDVGASDKYYTNAKAMGIHIEDVDYLILSHGHADHTGGLEHFLQVNSKATIILSSHIKGKQFYSYRLNRKRNISINHTLIEKYSKRFVFIDINHYISKQVGLICQFTHPHNIPKANRTLFISDSVTEESDSFTHEIALTVHTPEGLVILSGCAHNGLLNTLQSCSDFTGSTSIVACIGGTHLLDSDIDNQYESAEEIIAIGKKLQEQYPLMHLYTGHCTGSYTIELLSSTMKDYIHTFYSGLSITL